MVDFLFQQVRLRSFSFANVLRHGFRLLQLLIPTSFLECIAFQVLFLRLEFCAPGLCGDDLGGNVHM